MALKVQRDDWLEQSLRSALDQTVPTQVIVVTAAQTPKSNHAVLRGLASTAGDLLQVYQRPRPGFAVALNEAFRRADAVRVGLLHSDDWLDSRAIEASLGLSADIVSAGKQIWAEEADGGLLMTREVIGSMSEYRQVPTLEHKARYLTHFFFFSRAAVLDVGGVDETLGDLSGVDDFEMVWRMLEAGASVAFTAGSHYRVRDHPGDRLTMRSSAEQLVSLGRMLDKHAVDPGAGTLVRGACALVRPDNHRSAASRRVVRARQQRAGSALTQSLVPDPKLLGALRGLVQQPLLDAAKQLDKALLGRLGGCGHDLSIDAL